MKNTIEPNDHLDILTPQQQLQIKGGDDSSASIISDDIILPAH